MNRKKLVTTANALLATAALGLPLAAPAHAGYDEPTGRASGSYSSNRSMSSGRGMYGSYNQGRTSVTTMPSSGWVTVQGVLIEDADDKNFAIRDAWGRTFDIETSRYTGAEATNKFQSGQRVRVYGSLEDGKVYATNVRLVTGVAQGTRVLYRNVYYTIGQLNTITGTLVTDADDDEFEIRADNGQVFMVRTRSIPDSYGANKLQEGQRVRVHGYWIAEADGVQPQLEALSFRPL